MIIMHSNYKLYSIAVGVIFMSIFYFETSYRYLLLLIFIAFIISGLIYYALSAQVKRRQAEIVLSLNQAQIQARSRRRNFVHSTDKRSIPDISNKYKSSPLNPWGITGNPTSVRKKSVIRISPVSGLESHRGSVQHERSFSSVHKVGFTAEVLSSCQSQSSFQPQYDLGSFPTVNLIKSPLPSLSMRNSNMVLSPVTVKIAPPQKNASANSRFELLNDTTDQKSAINSVITALQSCRKRPKIVADEVENQVKRQRRDSSSSTGSAFTSMNSNTDGIFNGMLRTTANLSPPVYPIKDTCISSQKRSFTENNDYGTLKKFKNNEIFSSYSSSRKLMKQKRRKILPSVSSKMAKSLPKKPNNLNIMANQSSKEISPKIPEAIKQLSNPTKDNVTINDSNENKSKVNQEVLSASHLLLLEGLSRKRQLPLYTSLDGITFNKPLHISEYNTSIDDVQKDQQACQARLQEIISRVNNVFDAKDRKIKQNSSTIIEAEKPNLYEISTSSSSLLKLNNSLSSNFNIITSVTTTPTITTTTICSTNAITILTTSTCTTPSPCSSNPSKENYNSAAFLQSNDITKSIAGNAVIPNSLPSVSACATDTLSIVTPEISKKNSSVISPQQSSTNAAVIVSKSATNSFDTIRTSNQNGQKEGPTYNIPHSASLCFNLSSNAVPIAPVFFTSAQNEITSKPTSTLLNTSSSIFTPAYTVSSIIASSSPSSQVSFVLPSTTSTSGNLTIGASQTGQSVTNTSTNSPFQIGATNLFSSIMTNTTENKFLTNTNVKSDSTKSNVSVITNTGKTVTEKLNSYENALISSPSITKNFMNNSFFLNNDNLKNESLSLQTSNVNIANHSLTSPNIPVTSTFTGGLATFQNSAASSANNSLALNFGTQSNKSVSNSVTPNQTSTPTFQFGNSSLKSGGFTFGNTPVQTNALNSAIENKGFNTQETSRRQQNSAANSGFNFTFNSGLSNEKSSSNMAFNFSGASSTAAAAPFVFGSSNSEGFNFFPKTADSTPNSSNSRRPLQARRRTQQRH